MEKPSLENFISALLDFVESYVDSTEEEFNRLVAEEEELRGKLESPKDEAYIKFKGITQ